MPRNETQDLSHKLSATSRESLTNSWPWLYSRKNNYQFIFKI